VGLALLCPQGVAAQAGATTEIVTGRVTGPDGSPIAEATVEATAIGTELTRSRATDQRGRFTIVFPDGTGQYVLVVRAIGFLPVRTSVRRLADEDRLTVNVQLGAAAQSLAPVTVTARNPRAGRDRRDAGGVDRVVTGETATRLPVDASDLATLATLAPGVVGLGATDSTSTTFSVAGLRADANNITLDGLSFGSGTVPQDAVRSTRVVTSTYDVSRGQFSGGLVASTTKSGTNSTEGSFTYSLRDHALAWGGTTSSPFGQGFTQNQIGGGLGGALVHDRLFVFGSVQARFRDQALPSLASADALTLGRVGVVPDSVSRLLSLAGAQGIPLTLPGLPDSRATDNVVGLARVDWLVSDATTLTVRLDGRWNSTDPTRVGALALPTTGGTSGETGGGVLASATSRIGGSVVNELRGYLSASSRDLDGFLQLPQGRVQVVGQLGDSARGVSTLAFGGNPSFPEAHSRTNVELADELSWLPGEGSHRLKLGVDVVGSHFDDLQNPNALGTFTYNSLGALAANTPSTFTRTIAAIERAGTSWNGALYAGDSWRRGRLQLSSGLRAEATTFRGAPTYSPLVDQLFGLRTDQIPGEFHLSPRLGFTWLVPSEDGPAEWVVRGGAGDFRNAPSTTLYGAALAAPGTGSGEAQLSCIGAAVPVPDWTAYLADPTAIPTQCVASPSAPPVQGAPSVTTFDPSFATPHAWRGSLGVQRRLAGALTASADLGYARGMSQYGFRDANLVTTPRFTLAAEGGRPVYVPAARVVPATGAVSLVDSRLQPELSQVLVVGSGLASDSRQLTLGLSGVAAGGVTMQVSYTYMRARDQSSFSGGAAVQGFAAPTTAGDPNTVEWATSSLERRHMVLATVAVPVSAALQLTTVARLSSGVPYTPLVGSDINGDGARNDRAFIFDPGAATDSAVAASMTRLLAEAPGSARSCLAGQLSQVAGRNSCRGPWQPSLDLQLNWRPAWLGLARRLTISLTTTNLLTGLDDLLHGADDLHGWGTSLAPDPVLLYVRGFDPAAEEFRYAVNERFGSTGGANNGIIAPFQLGIQAHLTLGPDRTRGALRGFLGRREDGPGGPGGPPSGGFGGGADEAGRERALRNPVAEILQRQDSLHFTPEQRERVRAIADTLARQDSATVAALRAVTDEAGDRPDPSVLFSRLRPLLMERREHLRAALDAVRGVLTPDQWAQLPEELRTVRSRGPRGP
jgi:hypothetical protein